jgi:hypothetical protein
MELSRLASDPMATLKDVLITSISYSFAIALL